MLRTLRIQNYALIDDLTIEWAPGLNVLTGETGAGKSTILGALSLVLGEKADPDSIRTGKDSGRGERGFRHNPHNLGGGGRTRTGGRRREAAHCPAQGRT